MSLWVHLYIVSSSDLPVSGILVRENGQTVEITEEEWERRNPGVTPYRITTPHTMTVWELNVTHNLVPMARALGVYEAIWCPEDIGCSQAWGILPMLRDAYHTLRADREDYRSYEPGNGWGTVEGMLDVLSEYLRACAQWPHAAIDVRG
jgi:hypothetical protein